MKKPSFESDIVETKLHYRFETKELLFQAFLHTSYLNEIIHSGLESNERLEFLGDSVLNLFVTNFLFQKFPELPEGVLSQYKATLICQKSCAAMLELLDVFPFLLAGKGVLLSVKTQPSIASDLFEAIVGAIFLDRGYEAVSSFLHTHFSTFFEGVLTLCPKNSKILLQEISVKKFKTIPKYQLISVAGPSHEPLFTVHVFINGKQYGSGTGKNKREAELFAAKEAILSFETHDIP